MKYFRYVFNPKTKMISRKEYWKFFGISLIILFILLSLGKCFESYYQYGFDIYKYFTFLSIVFLVLNIILQIKRLKDANISPYCLFVYVLSIISFIFNTYAFIYIMYIVLLILLLLPTQRPFNTNLTK